MSRQELYEAARRQPFHPFRVTLTTGETHEIRHPELIMVGQRSAVLGLTKKPQALFYDRTLLVDLLHIVALETLPASTSKSNGK